MIVYFLRHAEAEGHAESDYARSLTAKGLEQAEKVGKFCLRLGLHPDLVLTSPLVRARQTAENVAKILGKDLVVENWLASGMSSKACLRGLVGYSSKDSVFLVGHEPDFSSVISDLLGMSDPVSIKIRKASLAAVDLPHLTFGSGQLQFLIPPRLM